MMVTVPGALDLPWEFFTVYEKVATVAVVGAGLRDTVNPPWASTSRVPPAIVGAGEVTTVRGRLFGSVFGARRPGDAIFRYVADFAV